MTTTGRLDVEAEAGAITISLKEHADPSYEQGMRRTVPSQQPAHAVRVPVLSRIAASWSREHKDVADDDLRALFEALWQTGWREERIVAMGILGRNKDARTQTAWADVDRWSRGIDNWELVDHMAGAITGPLLVASPDLISAVEAMAASEQSWQRRLAIVTLIEAARDDARWLGALAAMCERLKGDRGPTMRKAVDWGRRTLAKLQARGGVAFA